MATWGPGSFDNDMALDWAYELEETSDLSLIKETLQNILDEDADEPDADECQSAIGAAEIVASMAEKRTEHLPDDVRKWLKHGIKTPSPRLIALASRTVEHILTSSELREMWAENGASQTWATHTSRLLERLRLLG